MKPLRDKSGRFVSAKDVGKKEVDLAIRIWSQEPEPKEQDALSEAREVLELILILTATIGILMWIFFRMVGK